jgi:hypothetical protein
MFRGLKRQMSGNLSLKQHAGQSPIHTQLGSRKIDRMMYIMYKYILTCRRLLDGAHVCMRSECSSIIVDLLVSLWNLRALIGLVPCAMVSRSIVVHWDGAWSASHPWSAVLSAEVGHVRTGRALSIAAQRQHALNNPILPFSTLP